jgi:lysyl-tRNA synthetase class 2
LSTSPKPARTSVVDLERRSRDTPRAAAGRVVAVAAGRLLLADDTGSAELAVAREVKPPRAGDIVEVTVRRSRVEAMRVLTPYRGAGAFPSPSGEFHRLRSPLAGMPPALHRASLLRRRAACLAAIRAFFDGRGYLEAQVPHRVRLPGLEPHLVPVASGERFLITSPEYHMKRLLAGGLERIYSLGPCWRGEEEGPQHLGEFTMLEWYRAFSTLDELMEEAEELLRRIAIAMRRTTSIRYAGRPLELGRRFERLAFAAALKLHAGLDAAGVTDVDVLRQRAEAAGIGPFGDGESFDAVASRILVERVEPALARSPTPVFLHDFPAPLCALARLSPGDPTVAERFELYAGGLELANAFGELTDPEEQRRRLEQDLNVRRAAGGPDLAIDERFLAALAEGIPPSAGIALGVDRLVMLLVDAPDIRHVVAFPPDAV